jgi:hypothetical protein
MFAPTITDIRMQGVMYPDGCISILSFLDADGRLVAASSVEIDALDRFGRDCIAMASAMRGVDQSKVIPIGRSTLKPTPPRHLAAPRVPANPFGDACTCAACGGEAA